MEITKQELPTEEEITTARVSHLHSLLREQAGALQPKDLQLATKFLKDAGVEAPTEDLTALVGKLCTFFIEQSASTHRKKMDAARPAGAEQDANEGHSQGRDDGARRHGSSDRQGPSRSRGSDRGNSRSGGRGGGYGDRRR